MSGKTAFALRRLHDNIAKAGQPLLRAPGFPANADLRCVPFERWRAECHLRALAETHDATRKAVTRAIDTFRLGGWIGTAENMRDARLAGANDPRVTGRAG